MNTLIKFLLVLQLFILGGVANAASNDTLLGPGDILKISVFEQPDLALEVRVSESGTITYPLIGEVSVGGETPAAAEKKIATKLESGGFLRNPHVSIIVSQLQSLQVSVLGQVYRPGRFPLEGQRTLADVLALASGVSQEGGDLITLIRTTNGQTTREVIDLAEMMRTGDIARNIQIVGGDIVYVERAQKFYIYGEVQRPSQYRLEHNMTVIQALAMGGGLTLRGTERGVKIKRRDQDGVTQVLKVKHDDLVLPNDVIYVQESLF